MAPGAPDPATVNGTFGSSLRWAGVPLLCAIAAGFVLVGCAAPVPAHPTTGPPPSTSASVSASAPPPAPVIAHPLDPTRFVAAPCAALTPAQRVKLGGLDAGSYSPMTPYSGNLGGDCHWKVQTGDHAYDAALTWRPAAAETFTRPARTPFTIEGYPAVFTDYGNNTFGYYTLDVAVNDQVLLRVLTTAYPYTDADPLARGIAAAVLSNLAHP